ncbi:uncharacterized protein BS16045_02761 [Bacillus subtilis]|nr:uncharacterized protein BS16045_02761 [Bacillus subtilis]
MRYTNSHLEDWIENLYRKIDITEPEQINFERIAEALDIRLSFKPVTSFALKHSGIYNICLDSRKSRIELWYDFAHEFCHIYRHEGDKKNNACNLDRLFRVAVQLFYISLLHSNFHVA